MGLSMGLLLGRRRVCLPRMMSSELRATVSSGLIRPPANTGRLLNEATSKSSALGFGTIHDTPSHSPATSNIR